MICKLSICCIVLAAAALDIEAQPAAATSAPAASSVQAIAPPLEPLPPEALSAEVTQFSFIVYGDTRGRRDGKEVQYEHSMVVDSILETIRKLQKTDFPVRFVLQTGDAVVNGRDARQWNNSFLGLINRITKEGGVPYYLAPGNHDVTSAQFLNSPGRKEGLANYLAAVAQLIPPDGAPRRLRGYPTYAFGYGNSFFIAMDSNIAADEIQYEWTTGQLEGLDRNRFRNVFAFFHHPAFSSGPHGGSTVEPPTADLRKRYMPLFRKHHVAALFTGHEHFFEHWVERYEDTDGRRYRMDQIVTGGGGAPLYAYRSEPDLRDYLKNYAAEKIQLEHLVRPGSGGGENPYHFVVVQVNGKDLRTEVVGVDWGRDFQPYRSRATDLRSPGK